MMKPASAEIQKEYARRGPMHQYRLHEATAFRCFRCGESKKSKLLTTYEEDWRRLLCNGCYGRLLSLYEIKAGTGSDDENATALAALLLSLYNQEQAHGAERLFQLSEHRARFLTPNTLRFIATSEHISKMLVTVSDLDWSSAIIGLCKAVETEVIARILIPLAQAATSSDIRADTQDKDIGRVAKFCADTEAMKPPELGSFAHFLQTALNSESRRTTSPMIGSLFNLFLTWPDSAWLADSKGFHQCITRLTREFRNRAAHVDLLCQSDYNACRALVIGEHGMLWKLILATQAHK